MCCNMPTATEYRRPARRLEFNFKEALEAPRIPKRAIGTLDRTKNVQSSWSNVLTCKIIVRDVHGLIGNPQMRRSAKVRMRDSPELA